MSVAISMVTVYFAGLVHFYAPSGKPEIIVPMASPSIARNGVALQEHGARVVIKGLTRGSAACSTLAHSHWMDSQCTVSDLSGEVISLPGSTGPFKKLRSFDSVPKLRMLCPGIGRIRKEFLDVPPTTNPPKYAARLTIERGELGACTNRYAWVSFITTPKADLQIGATRVALNRDAIVWIFNTPAGHSGSSQAHFWWYYTMFDDTPEGPCSDIPEAGSSTSCPWSFYLPGEGSSGDIGCSNSAYP